MDEFPLAEFKNKQGQSDSLGMRYGPRAALLLLGLDGRLLT